METPDGMSGVLRSRSYGLSRRLLRAARVGPVGVNPRDHALAEGRDGVGLLHLLTAGGAGHDVNHGIQFPRVLFSQGKQVTLFLIARNALTHLREGSLAGLKLGEEESFVTIGHIVSL